MDQRFITKSAMFWLVFEKEVYYGESNSSK